METNNTSVANASIIADINKVVATTLTIVGCLTNLICIYAIFKAKIHRNLSSVYLFNIFAIDFLESFITLLSTSITSFLSHLQQEDLWCRINGYFLHLFIGAEIFGLSLISLGCYVIIVPRVSLRKHFSDRKRVVCTIMATHLLLALFLLLPVLGIWGKFSYGDIPVCTAYGSDDNFGVFIIIACLAISFPIVVFAYGGIILAVWKSKNKVQVESSSNREPVRNRRLLVNVASMIIAFVVLYFPVAILLIDDPKSTEWNVYVRMTLAYLGMSHCVFIPLVYTISNRKLRRVCVNLLTFRCTRTKR